MIWFSINIYIIFILLEIIPLIVCLFSTMTNGNTISIHWEGKEQVQYLKSEYHLQRLTSSTSV